MFAKKSILTLSLLIFTPLMTIGCSNVTNNKTNQNTSPDIDNNEISSDMIFPKIYIEDYYDYVEFDENAKPILGDKFIFKVLSDVLSRVSTIEGEIKFMLKRYSKSSLEINFVWIYNDYEIFKTYSFEISN